MKFHLLTSALLLSSSCIDVAVAQDDNFTENETLDVPVRGETVVDVLGQSGKFTVFNSAVGRQSGITVTMDAIREVDADGNAVGASGNIKHSLNTFASQEFTIDDLTTVEVNGLSASRISFSSPISEIGKIKVDTFVMEESGEVGPPGELSVVNVGDLKWNVELSEWTFCGCSKGKQTEEAAYIDLDVSVKGLGDASFKKGSSKSLDLGGGVTLDISDQVMVDGSWVAMPTGYPSVTTKGSSTTFTFRFPRFETKATYDPVLSGLIAPTEAPTESPTSAKEPTAAPTSEKDSGSGNNGETQLPTAAPTSAPTAAPVVFRGSFGLNVSDPAAFVADDANKIVIADGISRALSVPKEDIEVTLSVGSARRLRVDEGRRLQETVVNVDYVLTVPTDAAAPTKAADVEAVLSSADIVEVLTTNIADAANGAFEVAIVGTPSFSKDTNAPTAAPTTPTPPDGDASFAARTATTMAMSVITVASLLSQM